LLLGSARPAPAPPRSNRLLRWVCRLPQIRSQTEATVTRPPRSTRRRRSHPAPHSRDQIHSIGRKRRPSPFRRVARLKALGREVVADTTAEPAPAMGKAVDVAEARATRGDTPPPVTAGPDTAAEKGRAARGEPPGCSARTLRPGGGGVGLAATMQSESTKASANTPTPAPRSQRATVTLPTAKHTAYQRVTIQIKDLVRRSRRSHRNRRWVACKFYRGF
jgi:hypothetical protein